MQDPCPYCEGSRLRVVQRSDGSRAAVPCGCASALREARQLERAHIPDRYKQCTLEDFVPNFGGANQSLGAALLQARNFVRAYPFDTDGNGLLFIGSVGVGKTHLAVGILQALISEKGIRGIFVDYRDLLKQIQNTYRRGVETSETKVLQPIFDAEVLVLDELGAARRTDWVADTVAHILNTRYNDRRTTIITTNYRNAAPSIIEEVTMSSAARHARRDETLGDRIGERIRSRLQEMCVVVEMQGDDFRQKVKRARFATRVPRSQEESDLSDVYDSWQF